MQKPIILISHIPLCSENTPLLRADTERIRGENRLIDPDLSVEMDSSTKEFYNLIVSENSPVVAVLCGHNHFEHEDMLTDNIVQYVADCATSGKGYLITVKGK